AARVAERPVDVELPLIASLGDVQGNLLSGRFQPLLRFRGDRLRDHHLSLIRGGAHHVDRAEYVVDLHRPASRGGIQGEGFTNRLLFLLRFFGIEAFAARACDAPDRRDIAAPLPQLVECPHRRQRERESEVYHHQIDLCRPHRLYPRVSCAIPHRARCRTTGSKSCLSSNSSSDRSALVSRSSTRRSINAICTNGDCCPSNASISPVRTCWLG